MPFLTFPLALMALSSLPVLAGIYWLRNRYRRQVVSSLCLWEHANPAREGGRRIEKLQIPLLFLLELLILALLALGATGPRASTTSTHVPLTVVLDDSYSMLAGDAMSARTLGSDALTEELHRGRYSLRFILAGPLPQTLGASVHRASEALRQLEGWTCRSATANLDAAIALAAELGGAQGRILVVSDAPPPFEIPSGSLQWWAFGRARANSAFVGAARNDEAGPSRCMFEVVHMGEKPAEVRLTVQTSTTPEGGTEPVTFAQATLQLEPGRPTQHFMEIPSGTGPIVASLSEDDLMEDNRVLLLPSPPRTVGVKLAVTDEASRQLLTRTFEAMEGVDTTADFPDLLVTDQAQVERGPTTWTLRLVRDDPAVPYLGPFVVDRAHPLGEGLGLEGVIWAAAGPEEETTEQLAGRPVVTAGNVVLVSDDSPTTRQHDLRVRLRAELSTLTRSPAWPVFFWNLVQWRRASLPGVETLNLRTGDEARITLAMGTTQAQLQTPAGEPRPLPAGDEHLRIPLPLPGLYTLQTDKGLYSFAANVLHADESDLGAAKAGKWGQWSASPQYQREYRSILWAFAAAALGLLVLHAFLVARAGGKGVRA